MISRLLMSHSPEKRVVFVKTQPKKALVATRAFIREEILSG
jgi:hypothetical protein